MSRLRRIRPIFVIFFLLLFGFTNPADFFDTLLSLCLLLYVGFSVFGLKPFYTKNIVLAILPVLFIFLLSSYHNSQTVVQYISREPQPETYRSDLDDFLRTYYLMEKGSNYYAALSQAVAENAFKGYIGANLWAWRLPTIFYIWQLLPGSGGLTIYYSFLLLAVGLFACAFLIARLLVNNPKSAIIAPYLLYPYLHFAARDQILLHTEWWALLPMLISILCLLKNRTKLAIIFMILALSIRELFVIPIIGIAFGYALRRQKEFMLFTVPVFFLSILLAVHYIFVKQYAVASEVSLLVPRLHAMSHTIITATLAFSSGEYLFYFVRPFVLFCLLVVATLVLRPNHKKFLLLCFFLFPISFLFIGSSVYNDYWGIFYLPIVFISLPILI